MDKEFYDKYSDGLKCYGCDYLLQCEKSNSPILAKCIPNMNYVDKIIGLKDKITNLEAKLEESEKTIEELKGKRLEFYIDDVRQTQVINGVHFDIEQLLVFSEYVEHIKQQLAKKEKEKQDWIRAFEELALESIDHESYNATVDEYEKEIEELKIYQNQTAIAELEKVKEWLEPKYFDKEQINYLSNVIDQQIKELKGDE